MLMIRPQSRKDMTTSYTNLVAQVKPDEEMIFEYGSYKAMLIARFIQDITMNVNKHGASFAQQYMLQKGMKVFGNKGKKHR
jgi:hypothetical protein